MADQALVSIAQQFTGLPMDALIGGPLNAAAKANAAMALTQTKFILDTGFQPGSPPGSLEPIMITLSITRGIIQPASPPSPPDLSAFTTTFQLPLLTIIPINSLGVDNVDITFEMEVQSSFSDEQTNSSQTQIAAEASFEVKLGWGPVSATVKGSASYDHQDSSTHSTHYQKSNSAKYTVNVHAGQLPLPNGVTTILEAYTRAIEPIQL